MAGLVDDMRRLRDEIEDARHARADFFAGLKQDVSNLKAEAAEKQTAFRNSHFEAARKMKEDLQASVWALQTNVAEILSAFNNGRAKMAETLHTDLKEFVAGICDDVSQMRNDLTQMRNEFQQDHTQMAANLRNTLSSFKKMMKEDVAAMLSDMRNERFQAAMEENAKRTAFFTELRNTVADFRKEFTDILFDARQAWFGRTMRENHTVPAAAQKKRSMPDSNSDDLTRINGIGPKRQKQLNAAGIHSFVQLANCTPEALQETLDAKTARLTNVAAWIEQAKKFI